MKFLMLYSYSREGKKYLIVILCLFGLSACSPNEIQIQTAITQTQAAEPTLTPSPSSTATLTPTPTITPTITSSPTSTPDVRIIVGEPKDFQLKPEDLPLEAKYYLPNYTWTGPHLNSEVVSGWTVEKGKAYIADTGRITGYESNYAIGVSTLRMPDEVGCNVVKYQTPEGAQKTTTKYSRKDRYPMRGWIIPEIDLNFGDYSLIEFREINESGAIFVHYRISFSYKNFNVECYPYGLEEDVSHEFLESVSRTMLNKLKTAELGYPPTAVPTITEAPGN